MGGPPMVFRGRHGRAAHVTFAYATRFDYKTGMPRQAPIAVLQLAALLCILFCDIAVAAEPVSAVSPDGRVRIELSLRASGEKRDVPYYRVQFGQREVVGPSPLGIELA